MIQKHKSKPRQKRRWWVKEWLKKREMLGLGDTLLPELKENEHLLYHDFLRMTPVQWDLLMSKVGHFITKQDTRMRKAIPANIRLAITIRYLCTGKSN